MNISDFAEDYIVDPKKGMRKLTAGLLNEVKGLMLKSKSELDATNEPAIEEHIAMEQGRDRSRPFTVK